MTTNLTSTLVIITGIIVCLAGFFFAWRMTRDKPTGRIAAMIGAISLSLLTAGVIYTLTRDLNAQPARQMGQPR